MKIIVADLEGVFLPEIWINVAEKTGIEGLKLTTRDISDYDVLMTKRLSICKENNLKIQDIEKVIAENQSEAIIPIDAMLNKVFNQFVERWEAEAGLVTFGEAVATAMTAKMNDGQKFELTVDQWLAWSQQVGYQEAHEKARAVGIDVLWDCERSRTPEGYCPVRDGIEYAIAKPPEKCRIQSQTRYCRKSEISTIRCTTTTRNGAHPACLKSFQSVVAIR